MSKKKGLIGFANLGYFPITADDGKNYTPGEKKRLIGARACSVEDSRQEYNIPGDDGTYAQGSNYESTTLTINVNEMDLENLAELSGAALSSGKELTDTPLDNAPQVALVFSALMLEGGYRMYMYYNAKLTNIKADLKAKLDTGNEVNQYQLTFRCSERKTLAKNESKFAVRAIKDAEDAAGLTWLDTIPAIAPGG